MQLKEPSDGMIEDVIRNLQHMDTKQLAEEIRLLSLELCYKKRTSHIGGAFSVADIIAVLYKDIMINYPLEPKAKQRDRLFYSKGHACVAMYSALAILGYFSKSELLDSFIENGSYFTSHVNHRIPGIDISTGSLGHALGVACGSALASKLRKNFYNVFSVLSDGEMDEGSNWEAILFAAHNRLDNLIMIIDYNKIQSFGRVCDVLELEPLSAKIEAFNWEAYEVNGHSYDELRETILCAVNSKNGKPKCIIAHTVKGKGVSFMEDSLLWHYKSPNDDEYEKAKNELIGDAIA